MNEGKKVVHGPIVISTSYLADPEPYFFRNDQISSKEVYIAQPADTLESAIWIIEVWNREKYNIGPDRPHIKLSDVMYLPFRKYIYHSNTHIPFSIHTLVPPSSSLEVPPISKRSPEQCKVLVYKKLGKLYYLALLRVETGR